MNTNTNNMDEDVVMGSVKAAVMRRVRFIYFLRRIIHGPVGKFAVTLLIGLVSMRFVAFDEVVRNLTGLRGAEAFGDFVLGAVINTEASVQFLGACAFVFLALAARDLIRGSSRLTLSAARS